DIIDRFTKYSHFIAPHHPCNASLWQKHFFWNRFTVFMGYQLASLQTGTRFLLADFGSILARCMVKRNNVTVHQLLIKWGNLSEEEATWEDHETITNQKS
ncbi:hypothetical protein Pfo_021748, partial [Paulownia fortunei]